MEWIFCISFYRILTKTLFDFLHERNWWQDSVVKSAKTSCLVSCINQGSHEVGDSINDTLIPCIKGYVILLFCIWMSNITKIHIAFDQYFRLFSEWKIFNHINYVFDCYFSTILYLENFAKSACAFMRGFKPLDDFQSIFLDNITKPIFHHWTISSEVRSFGKIK